MKSESDLYIAPTVPPPPPPKRYRVRLVKPIVVKQCPGIVPGQLAELDERDAVDLVAPGWAQFVDRAPKDWAAGIRVQKHREAAREEAYYGRLLGIRLKRTVEVEILRASVWLPGIESMKVGQRLKLMPEEASDGVVNGWCRLMPGVEIPVEKRVVLKEAGDFSLTAKTDFHRDPPDESETF